MGVGIQSSVGSHVGWFRVFLREGELSAFGIRDITFGANDGLEYVRIFIWKSKWPIRDGRFRILNATNETTRPVDRAEMDVTTHSGTRG